VEWISHRIFRDCVQLQILDDDVVRLNYVRRHTDIVDFSFFCDLDGGIETALCDWWLFNIDSLPDYEKFREWRDVMEDCTA